MPRTHGAERYFVAIKSSATRHVIFSRHFRREDLADESSVTEQSMVPNWLSNTKKPCRWSPFVYLSGSAPRCRKWLNSSTDDSSKTLHMMGMAWTVSFRNVRTEPILMARSEGFLTHPHFIKVETQHFQFLGRPSRITACDRRPFSRTRLPIYTTPKRKTLMLSFEGNQELIGTEGGVTSLWSIEICLARASKMSNI